MKSDQKEIEKKILHLYRPSPKKHFTYKQIIKKLLHKDDKEVIVKGINDLISKGKLQKAETNKLKLVHSKEGKKRTGREIEGVVDMTMAGSAFIISPDADQDIYVTSRNLNRAFDGDRVRVAVYKTREGRRPEGEVTGIVARSRTEFVGTLELGDGFGFVVPEKGRIPVDVFVPGEKLGDVRNGDRVIVRITDWPDDKKNPYGEIVERLSTVGNNDMEMKTILIENGFPLQFPSKVMEEVEKLDYDISEEEIKKRRDFRDVTTFTIDPLDAKDFDDALSLRKLDNGNWEIGVHIADVSHYVKAGTALDKEAYRRATSVYLVDRVLPMLPERLSNIVCSLRPDEDKLTFSAVFEMNNNGDVLSKWFGRTIIRSDRRFTYEEVQEVIETGRGDFQDEIKVLNDLALRLRETKFQNGAIAFETVEVKFHIDLEGVPLGVYVKERKEAHMLIEDFMLLANKEVAEYVNKIRMNNQQVPFVYRIHDTPDHEKLEEFARFARKFGYKVKMDTPKQASASLNQLMEEIKGKPEQDLLEKLAIRSMAKAIYTTKNIGHYGLAFDHYTHFTSPIRRFPDVLVHRVLEQVLKKNVTIKRNELEEQCTHSSWMERKAMDAERESVKYKQVEFLQNKIGEIYDGIITGVVHFGLFVEIIENKCEGLVDIETMRYDNFVYDEKQNALIGMATEVVYQLGDKIKIKVINTNLEKRRIDFELIED